MTVKQLIKRLRRCDPTATVLFAGPGLTMKEEKVPFFDTPKRSMTIGDIVFPLEVIVQEVVDGKTYVCLCNSITEEDTPEISVTIP
jgi:hypothetical protein